MPESHQPAAQQVNRAEGAASAILSAAVSSAVGGAIFGALAGYMFLPYLFPFEKAQVLAALLGWNLERVGELWFPAALGAAIGGIGGVIAGVIIGAKQVRRSVDLRKAAESLGSQVSPSVDPELSDKLRRFFPASVSFKVNNVIRTQMQGIRIKVGEMSFSKQTGTTADTPLLLGVDVLNASQMELVTRTQTFTQTVAYYESDTVHFPEFTLQPAGYMLNLLSASVGIQKIDFPAHPEFSRACHLTAVDAENTRRLFNSGQLLEGLSRRRGLHVASDSGGLIIYRPGKLCEAEELKGFTGEAAEIFRLFEDAACQAAATAETTVTAKEDIRAIAEKMPGLMGTILRKTLVTRTDVDAFIRQPLPRTIPANILRNTDKFAPFIFLGIGLAGLGAVSATVFGYDALASGKTLTSNTGTGLILGLVFLGIGSCIAYFAGRTRIRAMGLLRNGCICAAKIEKIDSIGTSINGKTVSRITVQFQAEGRVMQASCKIIGYAVQRAQKLAVDKKPAPILYDSAAPQRILFVDSLPNVSPEYVQ